MHKDLCRKRVEIFEERKRLCQTKSKGYSRRGADFGPGR